LALARAAKNNFNQEVGDALGAHPEVDRDAGGGRKRRADDGERNRDEVDEKGRVWDADTRDEPSRRKEASDTRLRVAEHVQSEPAGVRFVSLELHQVKPREAGRRPRPRGSRRAGAGRD
jgi:hypothetical protein